MKIVRCLNGADDGLRLLVLCICVLSLFVLSGCASDEGLKRTHQGELLQTEDVKDFSEAEKAKLRLGLVKDLQEGLDSYRLSPGDILEVMYHISLAAEAQDYRLGVNDEINIDFAYHPQYNRSLLVRPDGKITLPIKGDIHAAGLKPSELAAAINSRFSDILVEPDVTVNVNRYSSKIVELQKAITNAPRGQAKVCTIGPDGKIYLPLLRGIKAANRTIDELRDTINNEYRYEFNNLQVSVLIESITGNRVFVFGEVQRPGAVTMSKPMTVAQIIASVGGVLPTGSLEYIKVLYWNKKNEPVVRTVNMLGAMESLALEMELIVPNNSVVFVPKKTISKLNQFVDQYIRQLFLFQGSYFSFQHSIDSIHLNP